MPEARAPSSPTTSRTPAGTLIDVVVLCFAKSELKSLVGTDALRSVLEGAQRELFPNPDVMALQPVYELLESQPGFDAAKAVAPFCRIKQWEQQLRVKVEMPHQLDVLDRKTREEKALNCNAFDSDLEKLLKPATPTAQIVPEKKPKADDGPITSASFDRRTKIALVAAVIGIAAAGASVWFTFFRKGDTDTISLTATDISESIPLKDVRLAKNVVVATLADASWLTKPEAERRSQLMDSTAKIRTHGANRMILVDLKGAPIATLVVRKDPTVIFVSH